MKIMPEDDLPIPAFEDPILKRNYNIIGHNLLNLVDNALVFLKNQYVSKHSENKFEKFSADNFFNFIMRSYIYKKIKNQIRAVLNSAVDCILDQQKQKKDNINIIGNIDPFYLDTIVAKKYHAYKENDLTLLNTSNTHPGHQELMLISRLTYRICIIEVTKLLSVKKKNIKNYGGLVRATYKNVNECRHSLNAILSMFDQMIDCFERNDDMIEIPFYKPTYATRDFQYVRNIYEYSLKLLDTQLLKIFEHEV